MRIRTTWILALLCLMGLAFASAAQDNASEGLPSDNACYTGGSLEGRCDWPTEAEDDWAWACGWYIARVDTGVFTVNDVPEWCNYFVTPQVVCYNSTDSGQLDFILTGALNTADNVSSFASLDGTCSGGVVRSVTSVSALNAGDAAAACQSLLGPDYSNAVSLRDDLGYNTPGTWWACRIALT